MKKAQKDEGGPEQAEGSDLAEWSIKTRAEGTRHKIVTDTKLQAGDTLGFIL